MMNRNQMITVKGQLVDKNLDFIRPNKILAKEDAEALRNRKVFS